jgi:hypothetical protein
MTSSEDKMTSTEDRSIEEESFDETSDISKLNWRTPMSAPDYGPTPRQRQPGEHLWAIRKDGQQVECELRDHGEWGVEVQVYREREFLYGRRWPTRALALAEATESGSKTAASSWRERRAGMAEDNSKSLDILGIKPIADAVNTVTRDAVEGAAAFLSRICLPAAEEYGLLLPDSDQSTPRRSWIE